jgi:hypothetical protein
MAEILSAELASESDMINTSTVDIFDLYLGNINRRRESTAEEHEEKASKSDSSETKDHDVEREKEREKLMEKYVDGRGESVRERREGEWEWRGGRGGRGGGIQSNFFSGLPAFQKSTVWISSSLLLPLPS